jgi:uncharacterized membrane-anchored protein
MVNHGIEVRRPTNRSAKMLAKVPEITLIFWVIKILTTAMGEATSDFFVKAIAPQIAVAVAAVVLAVSLIIQFKADRYRPWIYWFAVVMVSIFGTMEADVLHIQFGIPYIATTIFFGCVLALIFIVWYACEKTLSIHSIFTTRREVFYWATVLITFALGTALGDLTATTLNLGFFSSGILFVILFSIPAIGHWKFNLNPILAFWTAYVLTRPLGASFADWFGVSQARGGLDFGPGKVSLVLTALIVILVAYVSATHEDVEPRSNYNLNY